MKKLLRHFLPNPFDRVLKKVLAQGKSRFLIVWNRGLGDIPLGLYALICRIRTYIPNASITFMTRKDLEEAFMMLKGVSVLVVQNWERGKPIHIEEALKEHLLSSNMFDVILERPDPTKWLSWQLGKLTPKLAWNKEWESLFERYNLEPNERYIGCHIDTETGAYYGYQKNWELTSWRNLLKKIGDNQQGKVILFGMKKQPVFLMEHLIDLRGETTLFEMLSIIKNRCRYLVAPDSGVLSVTYYVDANYPLRVVSLWADPRQGILRQRVASPNAQLEHIPLKGKHELISNISVDSVYNALFKQEA